MRILPPPCLLLSTLLLGLALGSATLLAQSRVGPPAPVTAAHAAQPASTMAAGTTQSAKTITPNLLPVQNYAVIVLGTHINSQYGQGQPPTFFNADDSLNVAYIWGDEMPRVPNSPSPQDPPLSYLVHRWSQGTPSDLSLPLYSVSAAAGGSGSLQTITYSYAGVTSKGQGYGAYSFKGYTLNQDGSYSQGGPLITPIFSLPYRPSFPNAASAWYNFGLTVLFPPNGPTGRGDVDDLWVPLISVGGANNSGTYYGDAQSPSGTPPYFDWQWIGGQGQDAQFNPMVASPNAPQPLPPPGLVSLSASSGQSAASGAVFFKPQVLNDNGWALGHATFYQPQESTPPDPSCPSYLGLWDGATLSLSDALDGINVTCADLNNQGLALLYTFGTGTDTDTGVLMDARRLSLAGAVTVRSLIPAAFRDEYALSGAGILANARTSSSGSGAPPGDGTLRLLCQDSEINGYAVLTYTPAPGDATATPLSAKGWSFARVGLPPGVWLDQCVALNPDGVITACGCADTTNPAQPESIMLLVPAEFQAQDGRINYGFDPPMKGVSGGDPLGHPYTVPDDPPDEPAWASVTEGSTSNNVQFVLPGSFAPDVQLHVTAGGDYMSLVSPTDRAALSKDKNLLSIAGAPASNQNADPLSSEVDGEIQAQLLDGSQVLRKLKIAIFPQRTVSVGIYRVIDSASPSTYPIDNAPSDQAVLNELNDVYQQAGIHFINANPHANSSDDVVLSINYDINEPTNDPETTRIQDGLVQNADDAAIEQYFITNKPPGDAWIILTKNSGIIYKQGNPPLYQRGSSAHSDDSPSYANIFCNANSQPTTSIPLVIAHEIGHDLDLSVELSVQHPGHDYGPYPKGTSGLMNPGGDEGVPPGRWLRHEDWIHANNYAARFKH